MGIEDLQERRCVFFERHNLNYGFYLAYGSSFYDLLFSDDIETIYMCKIWLDL